MNFREQLLRCLGGSNMTNRPDNDLPTDGRKPHDWKTHYTKEAFKQMTKEAVYLGILFVISLILMLLIYKGIMADLLKIEDIRKISFDRIMYCISAGLLGGVTFNIKIFYRAVARGYWNADRVFWRYMAPLMSLSVTVMIAAFMNNDVINKSSYAIAIGYFAGYFSENAMGKMYDIAAVLFGSPVEKKGEDENQEKSQKNRVKIYIQKEK